MNQAVFVTDNSFISRILSQYPHVIFLCDTNTQIKCLPLLELNDKVICIILPSGEANKNAFSLNIIWNKLLKAGANRNTVIVNLGGGVISDIGGFAASTYNRGIKFINVPTTLMAMVDAANGGKTGINFDGLKNYIGTFTQPESIFIWPKFLETLPFEQIQSGFAEMLKHGLIANKTYWETLSIINIKNEVNWLPLIQKSVEIKHIIVSNDFTEQGSRKFLNFGHTIGHAMESYFTNSNFFHGHFVAAGIICETYLSHIVGELDLAESQKIIFTLDSFFERIPFQQSEIDAIILLAFKDKKNNKNKINTICLKKIGSAQYDQEISILEVKESLTFYIS